MPSRSPSRSSVVCSRTSQLGLRLPMKPIRLPRNVTSRGANWSSCWSSNGTGRNTCSVMRILLGPAVLANVHRELDGTGLLRRQGHDPGARHDVVAAVVDRVELDLHVAGAGLRAAPLVDDRAVDAEHVAVEEHAAVLEVQLAHPAVVADPVGREVRGVTAALGHVILRGQYADLG